MVFRSRRHRAAVFVATVAALALVSAGCGDDDEGETGATGGETGAAGAVDVTVQEFAVIPASASAPAGDVTFNVTNEGPDDTHEFVVFATDLAPDALPTNEDGTVDEEGEGIEAVDEIEDIEVGDTQSLTVDLAAGNYVLICNIYEEDEQESHYQEGMRVAFTVE
ncbi:MAG TPA: hypothetical protein VKB32_06965 [Actinomycetota bacterium]|jgi:uncharacterized cupredoxin-like copper-binding protein|nr:hypothetical protein [Actinomycetota bacterium]